MVSNPVPYSDNQERARQKVAKLIGSYPNLAGVIGLGSLGPITVGGKVIRTNATIDINQDNVDNFGF